MDLVAGIGANVSFLALSSDHESDQRDKQAKDEGPDEMRKCYLIGSTFFFFKFFLTAGRLSRREG